MDEPIIRKGGGNNMKKFALYLVITLLLISFSSTNKPQQVVDMFEKNTPERLKIKKYDLTLFCNDVDFILENKSANFILEKDQPQHLE